MTTACMGGWCSVRERCKHYQAEDRRHPIERLCEPDTHTAFRPMHHDAFETIPIVERPRVPA